MAPRLDSKQSAAATMPRLVDQPLPSTSLAHSMTAAARQRAPGGAVPTRLPPINGGGDGGGDTTDSAAHDVDRSEPQPPPADRVVAVATAAAAAPVGSRTHLAPIVAAVHADSTSAASPTTDTTSPMPLEDAIAMAETMNRERAQTRLDYVKRLVTRS